MGDFLFAISSPFFISLHTRPGFALWLSLSLSLRHRDVNDATKQDNIFSKVTRLRNRVDCVKRSRPRRRTDKEKAAASAPFICTNVLQLPVPWSKFVSFGKESKVGNERRGRKRRFGMNLHMHCCPIRLEEVKDSSLIYM